MWRVDVEYKVQKGVQSPARDIFAIQDRVEKALGFQCGAAGYCFPTCIRNMSFYHEEEGDARKTRAIVQGVLRKESNLKWSTNVDEEK